MMTGSAGNPAQAATAMRNMAWSKGWCSYWTPAARTNPYPKRTEPELFEGFERGFYDACAKFGKPA